MLRRDGGALGAMSPLQRTGLAAAGGSAGLLLAALGFQYLGGYAPCDLCILQRWPHGVAILIGLALLVWPRRGLAMLGALALATGSGIAAYHVGVEQGWWPGPTTCTGADVGSLTPDELLKRILAAPVTRCDDISWSFLGLSMAAWNGLFSAGLAALWARAATR